ncbi:MAG: protein kinase [Anaerolineae bacterium]|jgi:serine/threonine protein kinase
MRDLIRQIVQGYQSLELKGQDEGYVVFSGEDPDTHQSILIKVLPHLLEQTPQIEARFQGLADTIRQLNHPNIAEIQKVGDQAGLPYVVTRALEKAQPLAAKLDQPWAVDMAADVVMQVGQALDYAYQRGVTHGDLTPDHVMIGEDEQVEVTDFGLAELQTLVGGQVKEASSPYLAPERLAGQPADARADVYSMAALLYSLLTKRQPVVSQGRLVPPSQFNPEVPPQMDQIVLKGLARDPDDRYPDASAFLAALGSVMIKPLPPEIAKEEQGSRCPRCGATNQSGRFCRKCGLALDTSQAKRPAPPVPPPPESILDEPIQVTKIDVKDLDVGREAVVPLETGKGVEVQKTSFSEPMMVATGDMAAHFPEPLPMPHVDVPGEMPLIDVEAKLAMPKPPPMPTIDWAELAPEMPEVPTIEDISVAAEDD